MTCLINLTLLPAYVGAKSLQSCPALCDHMDCSPLGSSVLGILQARILEWVAVSFSRGPSPPRDRTPSLLCLQHWLVSSLPLAPLGKPQLCSWLTAVVFLNLSLAQLYHLKNWRGINTHLEICASTCFLDQYLVLQTRLVVIVSFVVAVLVAQLCLSLCDHGLQPTRFLLCLGFSRQEYWSGLLCPLLGDLPDPGIEPMSPVSPALQADSLPTEPPGSP